MQLGIKFRTLLKSAWTGQFENVIGFYCRWSGRRENCQKQSGYSILGHPVLSSRKSTDKLTAKQSIHKENHQVSVLTVMSTQAKETENLKKVSVNWLAFL